MQRQLLDKACEVTTFTAFCTCVAGGISTLVHCFRPGWWGSQFAAFWICLLGGVLAVQAFQLYKKPQLSSLSRARYWLWLGYSCYMAAVGLILVVGYACLPAPTAGSISPLGWWAFTWFPSIALAVLYIRLHQQQQQQQQQQQSEGQQQQQEHDKQHQQARKQEGTTAGLPAAAAAAVAAAPLVTVHVGSDDGSGQRCQACSWQKLRSCWHSVLRVLGWSSIFWAVVLGYFLAMQAAWLAADQQRFPAAQYGRLVAVPIEHTDFTAQLFIRCVGPQTSQATFVLETGAGAPAASLFGLQDALAAAGRRSCSYDRLGSGFSDDAITPSNLKRIPLTLHSLLAAAGVSAPFILVGHSRGGQLALQYASLYPEQVAGLALLDSYGDTAINLQLGLIANATDAWGNERYTFTSPAAMQSVLSVINVARAVAPLGWTRFMSAQAGGLYPYQRLANAMYGGDKAWQGQWAEYAAQVAAWPDSLDERLTLAAPRNGESFFWGTGWRDFSPLPVLVAPAADTLASSESSCDLRLPACRSSVLAADKQFYGKQVLAYVATLSSNASLAVVAGGHDFPWANTPAAAAALLSKFAGV